MTWHKTCEYKPTYNLLTDDVLAQFGKLPRLKILNINDCYFKKDKGIKALVKENGYSFEILHVVDCHELIGKFYRILADYCPNLWILYAEPINKCTVQRVVKFLNKCQKLTVYRGEFGDYEEVRTKVIYVAMNIHDM